MLRVHDQSSMTRVLKFFILAVFFSCLLGFLGIRSEMFRREVLVVLYSAGVFLSAVVFGGLKFKLFPLRHKLWAIFSFFLPFFYLLLPFLFAGEMVQFYPQTFLDATAIIATTFLAAFFEETGWRGFLFDALSKTSWIVKNLLIGLMWAVWHYPAIAVGSYLEMDQAVMMIAVFTLNVVLLSFIIGWFREKTGSILPAALIHASHNLFYHFFGPYWPMSESGLFLTSAFVLVILALKAWKRPDVRLADPRKCGF